MIGRPTIAIIDDDPAVRESACFLLEVIGHLAVSYASAIDFLQRGDPATLAGLIVDHHMPRMSGLDLAEYLRARGHQVPILLITGAPSPAISTRAAALGIDYVLEKPPSERDLLAFINSVTRPGGNT